MSFLGLLIPIAVILLAIRIGKAKKKVAHWLLYAYIAVSAFATISIPWVTPEAPKLKKVSEAEFRAQLEALHAKLSEGKWESIDEQWLMSENSFAIDSMDTLRVTSERNDFFFKVYIEQKEQRDGKVDAFVFREGGFIIDGYDFSFKLQPARLYLRGQTLTIAPRDQSIRLSLASPEFTIRQFSGETFMERWNWGISGHQIVYLRVPQGIDIEIDKDQVHRYHFVIKEK